MNNPLGLKGMFRETPSVLLAVCAGVFLALRLGETQHWLPWWAAGYGDDLICLPLVLGWILFVQRRFSFSPDLVLGLSHSLGALLFFSLYFEVLLPRVNNGFTADPWDVLMYGAGWVIFQLGVNRPGRAVA